MERKKFEPQRRSGRLKNITSLMGSVTGAKNNSMVSRSSARLLPTEFLGMVWSSAVVPEVEKVVGDVGEPGGGEAVNNLVLVGGGEAQEGDGVTGANHDQAGQGGVGVGHNVIACGQDTCGPLNNLVVLAGGGEAQEGDGVDKGVEEGDGLNKGADHDQANELEQVVGDAPTGKAGVDNVIACGQDTCNLVVLAPGGEAQDGDGVDIKGVEEGDGLKEVEKAGANHDQGVPVDNVIACGQDPLPLVGGGEGEGEGPMLKSEQEKDEDELRNVRSLG